MVVTRTLGTVVVVAVLAGCSVTTTYAPHEVRPRVVISVRDDADPISAIRVVLHNGTAIAAARLAADGDRLVVETTDGVLGRILRERVASIEIRRRSGALTIIGVTAGSLAGLLFIALLLLS